MNLNPEIGTRLAEMLSGAFDREVQEAFQLAWDAINSLGDNNVTEQQKAKIIACQNLYNSEFVPKLSACKAGFEEYTDVATYLAKVQLDTAVTGVDVGGSVGSGLFDAARNL